VDWLQALRLQAFKPFHRLKYDPDDAQKKYGENRGSKEQHHGLPEAIGWVIDLFLRLFSLWF